MYVGLTLTYLGEMGILVEIAPLIPLLFVIAYLNWIVIPVEEMKLRAVFGEAYAQYCDRVGRWIYETAVRLLTLMSDIEIFPT